MKKEKKKYFSNLNVDSLTDNKTFWNTVKPLFSGKEYGQQPITLLNNEKIISKDEEVAEEFNTFFQESVPKLNIKRNRFLENDTSHFTNPVDIALHKFENHPSVKNILEILNNGSKFLFLKVTPDDIKAELRCLKTKKASTFLNIPVKRLKAVSDIVKGPLADIWNSEVIDCQRFPDKLKCADITPIFKKLERIHIENYRPLSVLPAISKISKNNAKTL